MPLNMMKNLKKEINIPTPSNINYMWNMGSILGLTLMIQIISGIMISMHYNSSMAEAFESVIHITRDVNNGWIMRSIHINGASMFFISIYLHIGKNMFNSSFLIKSTWNSGIIIIMMLMATAFLGYVLPWGQMSFWAATVITNMLSAIPIWGKEIVMWLWGGFSVDYPTLTRFFSLHFLLPFLISFMAFIHIMTLHEKGSSNPIAITMSKDKMEFSPYFTSKDILGFSVSIFLLFTIIFLSPYMSSDPENFIPADPMKTPIHIQPEWYFLFAYAILRSIPNKMGGVAALFLSILIFLTKTMKNSSKFSSKFCPSKKMISYYFFFSFFILTWIGMKSIETPFLEIGMMFSLLYFILILML